MINVKQINKSYGALTVLSDVSFSVGKGQKTALVGANGVGKSTLLKIIAGIENADSGSVEILPPGACIGYLPQELEISSEETIEKYLMNVTGIKKIEDSMKKLESKLDDAEILKIYNELQRIYIHLDGYSFKHHMEVILDGFGLMKISSSRKLNSLSGGQKSKVALCGILLKGVDILLLDEPTNNLDLPTLIWLENYLIKSKATCIIISHDRRFLDNVVSKVFEIDWFSRSVTMHTGRYTDYLEYKRRQIRKQKEKYLLQQEEIMRLKESIRQKKQWAGSGAFQDVSDHDKISRGARRDRAAKSARRAKAVEKRLGQMDKIDRPKQRSPLVIPLEPNNNFGYIRLENIIAGYTGFKIGPISLEINYGSRIGILGINGSGKSTLLKVMTGDLVPIKGKVVISPSLVFGNLMQAHENLPRNKTIYAFLKEKIGMDDTQLYALIRKFHLEANEAKKKISSLSPGGRARLLFAFFSAISANVLVLDEPTNHLDLEAIEALEEVLTNYTGTVILVSHDRYFLNNAKLNQTFILDNGILRSCENYKAYISDLAIEAKRLLKRL